MAVLIARISSPVLLAGGLAACMPYAYYNYSSAQQQQVQTVQAGLQAIKDRCDAKRRDEPGLYETLDPKIGRRPSDVTLAMLASTEKPTDIERKMILRALEITMDCQKESLAFIKLHLPAPVFTASEAAYDYSVGLGLELYHGRLTYGEYNLKMKEAATNYQQTLAQIEAELAKQNAEANARAQALAAQQQQLVLNYLSSYNTYMQQQQQLWQLQRPRQINCSTMGRFTTCNY